MSVSCQFADGRKVHVGTLPGRKRIALYMIRGCMLEVLAWFPSESQAADFCHVMWNVTYPDALPYAVPLDNRPEAGK
jgi:hypothetical protein